MGGTTQAQDAGSDQAVTPDGLNEVRLVGRVSGDPVEQVMPSGDVVVTLRLVVARHRQRRTPTGSRSPSVDTIDVACWTARTRAAALRLGAGDPAEVRGALRRRFFRAGGAAVSRYEVEAERVRRA